MYIIYSITFCQFRPNYYYYKMKILRKYKNKKRSFVLKSLDKELKIYNIVTGNKHCSWNVSVFNNKEIFWTKLGTNFWFDWKSKMYLFRLKSQRENWDVQKREKFKISNAKSEKGTFSKFIMKLFKM